MENGQLHDDQLFRAVHDRLSDYEAPQNGADWDAMSRSLDKLPKTSRFQWKISLNTILVILGITGLSVLGFALANHSSHAKTNTSAVPQVSEKQNPQVQNTSVVTNTSPSQNINSTFAIPVVNTSNTVSNNSSAMIGNNAQSMQDNATKNSLTTATADGTPKLKKHNSSDLRFGDQIDPRKGFIYNTQEDKNALNPPSTSDPAPFYDINNSGQIVKIKLKDSLGKSKTFGSDTTTINNHKPGAPVDGETKGFDPEAQQ
jgi:cytoskeletal protein RodZ